MKILYFTSAVSEIDFPSFNNLWANGINPSQQSFHNRFIRMLGLNDEIIVISKRPFSRTRCTAKKLQQRERTEGNIHWYYLAIPRIKSFRSMSCLVSTKRIVKNIDLKNTVIFADIINPYISFLAQRIAKKYKLPAIGIIRESPSNIIGTTKAYAQRIFSQSHDYDGYICVTKEIEETINPNNRPSLLLEGLIEDPSDDNISLDLNNRYVFYTGSTEEKYGIFKLIKAFKTIDDDNLSLLISGQENKSQKFINAVKGDKRIKILGVLPNKDVISFEKRALCCVNPAPYNEDLVRFCFPQKTLEYLSNSLTITTRNSKIQALFQDCCIYHDGKTSDSLAKALKEALEMSAEERNKMVSLGKKKVVENFSMVPVRKRVYKFTKQFIK